ncbi:hypothetical protein AX16_005146, partial [Volvariella volvacea WC 439]
LPIARYATYNAESHNYRNCASGTRTRHIEDFFHCVESQRASPVFVLITGSVGSGKTTLTRHLIQLALQKGYVVGDFSFSPHEEERSSLSLAITTIAHRLREQNAELRNEISKVISSDATICSAVAKYQWERLVVKPLQEAWSKIGTHTIIVLDGLDACSWDEQHRILSLLEFVTLPLTFLISSRPQKDVDDYFSRLSADDTPLRYHVIDLSNDPNSRGDTLIVIREQLPTLQTDEHNHLVDIADEQLSIVNSYSRNPNLPFVGVDKEYSLILLTAIRNGDANTIYCVLYHLIYLSGARHEVSIDVITRFWNKAADEVRIALQHLSSVVKIPYDNSNLVSIRNKSFITFIEARLPCKQFVATIQRLTHSTFLRSLSLAGGLLSSPVLQFPPHIYTNWIESGPRLEVDANPDIDFKDLESHLQAFPFRRWRLCWKELSQDEDVQNGDAFRGWVETFSTKSLLRDFSSPHRFQFMGKSIYQVPYDPVIKPLVQTHLSAFIARAAMYDGDNRPEAEECHSDTCYQIIDDITRWVMMTLSSQEHNVLWLSGAVGTGKSTLARTVASNLDKQNLLAGEFFFLRSDKLRNHILNLIPTLAYRMCIKIPQFGAVVERMLAHNAQILTAPPEEQWENLILRPLAESSSAFQFSGRMLIVIDGIDECSSAEDQGILLNYVSTLAQRSPFAFLLTSRPDPHVDALMHKLMKDHPQMLRPSITLGNTIHATRDIESVVRGVLGRGSLSPELQTEVVRIVSRRAAGQFSYAIQATDYLRRALPSSLPNPEEVLNSLSMQKIAFSSLDSQYDHILRSATRNLSQNDMTTLRLALFHLSNIRQDSIKTISALWDQSEDIVRSTLGLLPSVLRVPSDNTTVVEIYHPSFQEYLSSPERSGELCPLPTMDHLRKAFRKSLDWAGHCSQYKTLPELVFSLWLDFAPKLQLAGLDLGLVVRELSRFDFKKWTKTWYAEHSDVRGTDKSYEAFREWLGNASTKKTLLAKYNQDALLLVQNQNISRAQAPDPVRKQGWAKRLSKTLHISNLKQQIHRLVDSLPHRIIP